MIEKLEKQNTWGECLEKLNEVIDAVNELQISANRMGFDKPKENKQDPCAEQRKWIGCLVRYKICDWQGGWNTDVLDEIVDHPIYPFKMRNGDTAAVCEVVEPSEIYPNKARTW